MKVKGIRHSYPLLNKTDKVLYSKIEKKEYCRIVEDFLKFTINKSQEGFEVFLPCSFGSIKIVGKKFKPRLNERGDIMNQPINWKETYKLWNTNTEAKKSKERIYHLNEHTNNVRYKYIWSKKNIYATYKEMYAFILTRNNKRTLAKLLKEGKEFLVLN